MQVKKSLNDTITSVKQKFNQKGHNKNINLPKK
jgi:hypothetical protein